MDYKEKKEAILTGTQAYQAMQLFLEKYYMLTKSEDLGALLSGMGLVEDGQSADPAMMDDWLECIEKVAGK